jgi:hypothetical protein
MQKKYSIIFVTEETKKKIIRLAKAQSIKVSQLLEMIIDHYYKDKHDYFNLKEKDEYLELDRDSLNRLIEEI